VIGLECEQENLAFEYAKVVRLHLGRSVIIAIARQAATALLLWASAVVNGVVAIADEAQPWPDMDRVVEIRSYTLKPGTRERFHELFVADALPMLIKHQVDVVAYGPSIHDENSYFLIRAYLSLSDRDRSEDTFYGSREWIDGPRQAILECIEHYSTVVRPMESASIEYLRELSAGQPLGERPISQQAPSQ
jgi:hypothetical protein